MPLTALCLLSLLVRADDPDLQLSPEAKASKAAFASLAKLKDGVGEARLASLRMPGTREFLASPEGIGGLYELAQSFQKSPESAAEAFRLYADMLPKIDHLRGWDGYQTTYLVRMAQKNADTALAERVRQATSGLLRRTIAKHDFASPSLGDDSVVDYFRLDLAHVTGNAMRGALIDRPVPAMNFLWCSKPGVKRLSDLKGKVVVLDFWATWCKPCVSLFPKIREISASYSGKPVVFIGVTSLQGYSIDPEAGKVSCKGDPKKETSLMPGLMKKLGITWTVAFSDKNCFNPDFDIMEIPHMAVLDQNGVVRYDGVEPDALKERIDALLTVGPQEAK